MAPLYRTLEHLVFGGALDRCRRAFLPFVRDVKRALVIGDGDGRFSADFLRSNESIELDYVDSSAGMVRLAQQRLAQEVGQQRAVSLQHAPVELARLQKPYDLVVTHFVLDCFLTEELRGWVPRVVDAMAPESRWLISEFALPQRGIVRRGASLLIALMYRFFRLTAGLQTTQIPDYREVLRCCGLRPGREETSLGGVLRSELWTRTL